MTGDFNCLNALMVVRNLTSVTRVMSVIGLPFVFLIVPFMETVTTTRIVTTTTLISGSEEMTKYGAMAARPAAIADKAGMTILRSVKTGTPTKETLSAFSSQYPFSELVALSAVWARCQLASCLAGWLAVPLAYPFSYLRRCLVDWLVDFVRALRLVLVG